MRFLLILGLAVIFGVCILGPTSASSPHGPGEPRPAKSAKVVSIVNANDEIRTKILPHLKSKNLSDQALSWWRIGTFESFSEQIQSEVVNVSTLLQL